MWYGILFLVVGFIITAFGWWVRSESDQPKNHENVEGIKSGIWTMLFGVIVIVISLWLILMGIRESF